MGLRNVTKVLVLKCHIYLLFAKELARRRSG
jgi:hypothetical protein